MLPPIASLGPWLHPAIHPTYFWFRDFKFMSENLKIFLRCLIIFILTFHGGFNCVGIVIYIGYFVMLISWSLREFGCMRTRENYSQLFQIMANFPGKYLQYRQLQVIMVELNELLCYALPIWLFLVFLCALMSGYLLVDLANVLPMLILVCSLVIDISAIAIINAIFPLMARIPIRSGDLIKFWKLSQAFSKHRARQLKSCKALKIYLGHFRCLGRGSRMEFLSSILYYTATLVIAVWYCVKFSGVRSYKLNIVLL